MLLIVRKLFKFNYFLLPGINFLDSFIFFMWLCAAFTIDFIAALINIIKLAND